MFNDNGNVLHLPVARKQSFDQAVARMPGAI